MSQSADTVTERLAADFAAMRRDLDRLAELSADLGHPSRLPAAGRLGPSAGRSAARMAMPPRAAGTPRATLGRSPWPTLLLLAAGAIVIGAVRSAPRPPGVRR